MANLKVVTNDKIYELVMGLEQRLGRKIEDTSRDHKTELGELRRQFETLEAGRLTRAEGYINDLRLQLQSLADSTGNVEKTLSSKFIALGAVGMVLLSSLTSAFCLWLFTRIHK